MSVSWAKGFLIIVVLFLSCLMLNAQPLPPPPPNPVPISGIEILVGAGALLGMRKLIQRNKENL
jgi:hypothetical protein